MSFHRLCTATLAASLIGCDGSDEEAPPQANVTAAGAPTGGANHSTQCT